MLALVYHDRNDVRLEHLPKPDLPPGGLLLRPVAAGICGTDIRTWHYGSSRLAPPQVMGHEFAGVVEDSDVPDFRPGDRVAIAPGIPCLKCHFCRRGLENMCLDRRLHGFEIPGGFAEYVAIPPEGIRAGTVVPVPASLPLQYAPIAEPLNAVINGQERARIVFQDSVLVLGLGPIGILHMLLARARGAGPVLGADVKQSRVEAAKSLVGDAAYLLDGDWKRELLDPTGGRGFDVVIIANTAPESFATATEMVSRRGRILAFAGISGDKSTAAVDVRALHYREIDLIGAYGATPRHFAAAVQWLASRPFDFAKFVSARFPLDKALDAFRQVEKGEGVKTMLTIGEG